MKPGLFCKRRGRTGGRGRARRAVVGLIEPSGAELEVERGVDEGSVVNGLGDELWIGRWI